MSLNIHSRDKYSVFPLAIFSEWGETTVGIEMKAHCLNLTQYAQNGQLRNFEKLNNVIKKDVASSK